MAFRWPDNAVKLTLRIPGALSVADDNDVLIAPVTGRIFAVHAVISDTGTTSGNNDFVVERTRSGTDTDLWTVAAGVGRFAYNASAKYLDMDIDDLAASDVRAGDLLNLNVNAVAGAGTPTGLFVDIYITPQQ